MVHVRSLWPVVLVAVAVRLGLFLAGGDLEPGAGIERGYFATASALSSGYGPLMHTSSALAINFGFDAPKKSTEYMKEREAAGGRIDPQHPYPKTAEGWIPATLHPLGYSLLIWVLYECGNYTGTIWSLRSLQIAADSVACLFVFLFARNLFGAGAGRIAAWLYALCPPAVFLSMNLLLPDTFQGLLLSLVLALASIGSTRSVVLAGVVLGLACHFRTENVLLPVVLFFVFWANSGRLRDALGRTALLAAPVILVLLPWALWMKANVGEFRFTSTNGGGVYYSSIGEDSRNPWGIDYRDEATDAEAVRRGYRSAWSAEANRYFTAKFIEYVTTHPGRYLRTVLFHRLPFALATPYATWARDSDEFSFTKYRVEEGLSRWGVVKKYPLQVLRHIWADVGMMLYSAALTLCVVAVALLRGRDWPRLTWLVLPWASTVISIVILKGIEPRNLAPTLVPGVVAAAVVIWAIVERRRAAAPR